MKITAQVISCLNIQDQKHKASIVATPKSISVCMQTSLKPEPEQSVLVDGATFIADTMSKLKLAEDTFSASLQQKIFKKYKWVKELSEKQARLNSPKMSLFKIEEADNEFFHITFCGEFEIRIIGKDGSSALLADGQTHANMKKFFGHIGKQITSGAMPSSEQFKHLIRSLDESQSLKANTPEGANFLFAHKDIPFKPYFIRIRKELVEKVMISSYSLAGLWESYGVTPGPMELLRTPTQEELTKLIFELRKKERIDGFVSQYPRSSINPLHTCLIVDALN